MGDGDPHLVGVLGELVRSGFRREAFALLRARGGLTAYVPVAPEEGDSLVEIIGLDAARRLAETLGGQTVEVSNARGARSLKAQILERGGASRDIALAAGCSRRYVNMVRVATAPDPRQPTLFEGLEVVPLSK